MATGSTSERNRVRAGFVSLRSQQLRERRLADNLHEEEHRAMTAPALATFDPNAIRNRLAQFPAALRATVAIADERDWRWKPAPEHWSILEVCAHLLDEEHEDFRPRAELTLRDPTQEWPKLDLENVATLRRYNEKDPYEVLDAFTAAREKNMAWLDDIIKDADWTRARIHP